MCMDFSESGVKFMFYGDSGHHPDTSLFATVESLYILTKQGHFSVSEQECLQSVGLHGSVF